MLIVSNIDGSQVEPLTHHQGLKIEEEVNGSFTLSFTSFNVPENYGHEILLEESFISVEDHEFRVKQLTENQYSKSVVAIHTFFDLSDDLRDEIFGGTHTLSEFAQFIFNGTGWTYTTNITDSMVIENFGEANVITLINALCSAFKCEYQILPNRVVHFAYQIGPDNDAVFRYKHNVIALSKKIDTTKLKTYIEGYGADGLKVSYTSPNAATFGIRKAEPVSDDRFTQANSLLEYIKPQIVDTPEVAFELDTVDLLIKDLGERVWLIYEPMNVEFQTRILKLTKEIRNGTIATISVVLGNTLPQSTEDLLVSQKVEIDQNKKEYQTKFDQTSERITMEVEAVNESIATLEIKADSIETSVTNLETNTNARFTVMADQITSKVTAGEVESIFYQTANSFAFSAEQILFDGHVFGQGATFSGNLQTLQDVKVGANIEMQGNQGGIIRFPATGCWIAAGNTGKMTIETWNGLSFAGPGVDFSNVTVTWGDRNRPVAVWG